MGSSRSLQSSDENKPYSFIPFKFIKIEHGDYKWPKPRSGHRIVSNQKELYSYGGYNPDISLNDPDLRDDNNWHLSKPLFREVWKFNMALQKWTKVPALNVPYVLASNAVVLQGNILMVYGGTGVPFGGHCSNVLYVCNLSDRDPIFKEIEVTGDTPTAQYGPAVFVHQYFLYVIGGTTGFSYSCDVHRLDLTKSKWEVAHRNKGLPDEPAGRYRHELGLQLNKSKVYIFGGGTSFHSFGFQDVPVFDLKKQEWSTVITIGDTEVTENGGYPLPRKFHSLVQSPGGNDIFITGGESGIVVLCDSWKLDLSTLRWTRMNSMTLESPRYFHAASLTPQGKMYLFGGITANERSNDMMSAWLCIPSLQEICWEAIVHYKFLENLPKESLQQMLPPNFLERLD